jgi:hypothetical protein
VDLCWRVHAAGFRVRVITDAVVFHAQAMSKRRRAVSAGRRPQLLDRRNAMLTLAGNLPLRPMLWSLIGNAGVSLLRALFFLVAKRVTAALDESAAVASVLLHPLRLLRARRLRSRGRAAAYGRLRSELPPGRSFRRIAEFAAAMTSSAQQDTAGSHHATEDPDADDFLLTDSGLVQRILTSPSVLLFIALLIITIIAERSVLTAGSLSGGALLPAPAGASGLWHTYLQGFHAVGIGSPSTAPPYLAILAMLSTVLLGKAWLAVDVLLLGSVPIAGMTAYLAVRRVTRSVAVRVWAAASYALLPVATGAIAAGRLGTAVAFALIPVIGLQAGRMLSQPPRMARRAAWATGLSLAVAAAFVPLLWLIGLLAAIITAVALRLTGARSGQKGGQARETRQGAGPRSAALGAMRGAKDTTAGSLGTVLRNLGIAVVAPLLLLVPWTFQLAGDPAGMLLEAGAQQPGLASPDLPARSLLLLSPGGPGLPTVYVTAGLLLAALAALLASRRRSLIMSGWTVAVLGLLVAAVTSRLSVHPATGGPAVTVWPGALLAVAAAGLLLAASACGDSLGGLLAAGRSGLRRLGSPRGALVAVLALLACSAPVAAAASWVLDGISGPIGPAPGQVVPSLVAASAGRGTQVRTLVLSSAGPGYSYQLLRGTSPQLGYADLIPVPAAERALRNAVASLIAPDGGQAVNQGQVLAHFDIGFVLMRAPVNQAVARTLDGVPGLRPVSMTQTFGLWRLANLPARVSVLEPNGAVVPVSSGQVDVSGATVPSAGGTLLLAEPAGGWSASLNGQGLTSVASPAGSWAQAFRLPAGGGTLSVSRGELGHDIAIAFELLAVLVVAALALPGVRASVEARALVDAGVAADALEAEELAAAAAGRSLPERDAPDRGMPDRGAPDRGAPVRGAPGRDALGADESDEQDAGRGPADRRVPDPALHGRPPGDRLPPDRVGAGRGAGAVPGAAGLGGAAVSGAAVGGAAVGGAAVAGAVAAGAALGRDALDRDPAGRGPGRGRSGRGASDDEGSQDGRRPGRGGKAKGRGRGLGRRGKKEQEAVGSVLDGPEYAEGPDQGAPGRRDRSRGRGADSAGTGGRGRTGRGERDQDGAMPAGQQPDGRPPWDDEPDGGASGPRRQPDPGYRSPTGAWPYPDDTGDIYGGQAAGRGDAARGDAARGDTRAGAVRADAGRGAPPPGRGYDPYEQPPGRYEEPRREYGEPDRLHPGRADAPVRGGGWSAPAEPEPAYGGASHGGAGYDSVGYDSAGSDRVGSDQPGYGQPGYGQPGPGGGYGEPEHGAGGRPGSRHGAPSHDVPGYGTPGYRAPGYGVPGNGSADGGTPGRAGPAYGEPSYGAPDYGAPDYGAPDYGAPDYGAPDYGAPDYGAPEYGTPGYGAPDRAAGRTPAGHGAAADWQEPGAGPPERYPHEQGPRDRDQYEQRSYGQDPYQQSGYDQRSYDQGYQPHPGQAATRPGTGSGSWSSGQQSPGQQSSWPEQPASSWPEHEQPASWPEAGREPRSGAGRPPDWPAGGATADWRGGGQPASDPYYGQQPPPQQDWGDDDRYQQSWGGAGDSLEPLPSAELHHGGPAGHDDSGRQRWPAPDDERDARDRW